MSSSSDYAFTTGGSLNFKGAKKKKKKSSSSSSSAKTEAIGSPSGAGSGGGSSGGGGRKKTDAERKFEEIQRERMAEKIAKSAGKTHKDRVHEFNEKLEGLSEHHDIPRVGPG